MTIEELKKVPFRETCHMAMEGEYTTTYMSKDGRLGFCDHVPRDKYGMRTTTHKSCKTSTNLNKPKRSASRTFGRHCPCT